VPESQEWLSWFECVSDYFYLHNVFDLKCCFSLLEDDLEHSKAC
jgi:hypothetical protein